MDPKLASKSNRRFPRRGPLQLKRNMEKQKELLLEARRMLEKDLELLKVEEEVFKSRLNELTQTASSSHPTSNSVQQQAAPAECLEDDLVQGTNLPNLNLETNGSSNKEGMNNEECEEDDD